MPATAAALERHRCMLARFRQRIATDNLLMRRPSMETIAAQLGVSSRQLRAVCQDLGTSPYRLVQRIRLQAAHEALLAAQPGSTTVTDIAMALGFHELGRFAEIYRRAFGEVPSATLRKNPGGISDGGHMGQVVGDIGKSIDHLKSTAP